MKKMASLKNSLGVTLIFYFGFSDALVAIVITQHVMKKVPPYNTLMLKLASADVAPSIAARPENTSGAPFPKARSVTPASDS